MKVANEKDREISDIVERAEAREVINGSCTERQINVPKIEGVQTQSEDGMTIANECQNGRNMLENETNSRGGKVEIVLSIDKLFILGNGAWMD